jgi:hypothetical protein
MRSVFIPTEGVPSAAVRRYQGTFVRGLRGKTQFQEVYMRRHVTSVILGIGFALSPTCLHGDIMVSTTINLTQLEISPEFGTLRILSPFAAGAFAQAQDSFGGPDQQFSSADDGAVGSTLHPFPA